MTLLPCDLPHLRCETPQNCTRSHPWFGFDYFFFCCSRVDSKLALHLPHIVISDSGSAKWDAKRGVLSITLPIKPESD